MPSKMDIYRMEYDHLPEVVRMPGEFLQHHVAIIIQSLEQGRGVARQPSESLARFAGAWQGVSLVREEPGAYEIRNELK